MPTLCARPADFPEDPRTANKPQGGAPSLAENQGTEDCRRPNGIAGLAGRYQSGSRREKTCSWNFRRVGGPNLRAVPSHIIDRKMIATAIARLMDCEKPCFQIIATAPTMPSETKTAIRRHRQPGGYPIIRELFVLRHIPSTKKLSHPHSDLDCLSRLGIVPGKARLDRGCFFATPQPSGDPNS
jgi:hypothetical protein